MMTDLYMFSWLAMLLCTLHCTTSDYCSSKSPLSKMFTFNKNVYFVTQSGIMFSFDLRSKKIVSADMAKTFGSKMTGINVCVHFDPFAACDPDASNAQFCENSKVFADMVALVDGKKMTMLTYNKKKKTLEEYSHTVEFTKENDILPSIKSRLYSAIYLLFEQVAISANPQFTGGTYDHFTDSLYLAATISESVASLEEWGLGRYVLFRSNFAPNGLVQDSFVVASFEKPVTGLIDFNGNLFVLTQDNIVHQLNETMKVVKTFSSASFFCDKSNSPLMTQMKEPTGEHRTSSYINIESLGQLFFPHEQNELKFVDSALLTGGTFVLIVVVLSVLLVFIVVVDVYIVFSMTRDADNDDYIDDISVISSRKSSSTSSRSSKRSKSKSSSRS